MGTRTAVDQNVARFSPIDASNVYVLGTDGKLWVDRGPFGNVPPKRVEIDANVKAWRTVFTTGALLVLRTDNTLWLYPPVDLGPPDGRPRPKPRPPVQIDANVRDFYSYDGETVFVLGTNGHFWQEMAPFGTVPPKRVPVDIGVQSFSPMLENPAPALPSFLVLGSYQGRTRLLIENPPYGNLPPASTLVDEDVVQFTDAYQPSAPDVPSFLVVKTDTRLFFEEGPYGTGNPRRTQIDVGVKRFRGFFSGNVYVLSNDANGSLWLEFYPFGDEVPPPRVQIDSNVATFEALNDAQVYVLDRQGSLWFWNGPFSNRTGGSPGNDPGSGDGGGGFVGGDGGTTDDGPPTDDPAVPGDTQD